MKNKNVSFSCPFSLYRLIEKAMEDLGHGSKSELCRVSMRFYLEAKGYDLTANLEKEERRSSV